MFEVAPNAEWDDAWNVERIDDDGGVELAIFYGPNAEARARAYADHMNAQGG